MHKNHLSDRVIPYNLATIISCIWKYNPIAFMGIIILSICAGLILISPAYYMIYIFQHVSQLSSQDEICKIFTPWALIILFAAILTFLNSITQHNLILNLTHDVMSLFWEQLIEQPTHFFNLWSTGSLTNKLYEYRNAIENYAKSLIELVSNSIIYIIMFSYIASRNYYLCAAFIFLTVFFIFVGTFISRLYNATQKHYVNSLSTLYSLVFETVQGIQKIIFSAAEPIFYKRLKKIIDNKNTLFGKFLSAMGLHTILVSTLGSISILSVYYLILIDSNADATSALFSLTLIATQILTVLMSILINIRTINATAHKARIADQILINLNTYRQPDNKYTLLGNITVQNLYFKYSGTQHDALKNINLIIKPGEIIGIMGQSGSGKSTLIRVLIGFEENYRGKFMLDEHELTPDNRQFICKHIGIALQNQRLLSGTISDIVTGGKYLSKGALFELLSIVDFDADLKQFPKNINTLIGENGKGLSGGQKQKLLIASVLAKKPKILLLDESTSSIDNHSQARIIHNLRQLQVTTIIVAHRLQAIKHADMVYIMSQGEILEKGIFHELKQNKLLNEMIKGGC